MPGPRDVRPYPAILFAMLLALSSVSQGQTLENAHVVPRNTPKAVTIASTGPAAELRPRPFRKDVDLVLVPVTVSDPYNHPVTTLAQTDFVLYEGDTQQDIQYFSAEDAPLSIAMVLDFSASMKNKIDFEKEAINQFFGNANPADEYFVVTISSKPQLVAAASMSLEGLQNNLAIVEPHGGTALFDGIYLGLQQLRNARYHRKALLVISDGGDNESRYTLKEIRSMVAESDVLVYGIGLFDDVPLPLFKTLEERLGRKWLGSVTDPSGGRTFAADSRQDIPQIAALISRELRYQYTLGYKPGDSTRDGKWRKVTVKAAPEKRANLHVYFKQGYFAPGQ